MREYFFSCYEDLCLEPDSGLRQIFELTQVRSDVTANSVKQRASQRRRTHAGDNEIMSTSRTIYDELRTRARAS